MAIIEFINRKNKTYRAMQRVINYIQREDKTEPHLVFGLNCSPETAYHEFVNTKKKYRKETGRQYIHFTQSFSPKGNVTPEIASKIARKLLSLPQFKGFKIIVATHTDMEHIHTHFVVNSVNSDTGRKWQQSSQDLQALKDFSDELCREYGLTVIDNQNKNKGYKSGGEYRAEERGESWKYELFLAVTECMKASVSRDDFIKKMNILGYQVLWEENRKYITFITPEGKKCRNRKLYPPERFTKENMEKVFERNRFYIEKKEHNEKWNLFISTLNLLKSNPRKSFNPKLPLTSLEGEALKEYMLLHENEGEIEWENDEYDFEL